MIVLDASAAVELLLRTVAGKGLADRINLPNDSFHVPHLLDIEVAHVVRRYWMRGDLDDKRARAVLDDLAQLPLSRYPHAALLPRIWELRNNLTAYDATYIALAESLNAVLVTRDKRLASAAGHDVRIDLM